MRFKVILIASSWLMMGLFLVFLIIHPQAVAETSGLIDLEEIAPPRSSDWGVYTRGSHYPSYGNPVPINTDSKLKSPLKPRELRYFSLDLEPGIAVNIGMKALQIPSRGVAMVLLGKDKKILRRIKIDETSVMTKSSVYRPAEQGTFYVALEALKETMSPDDFLFKVTLRPLIKDKDASPLIGVGSSYPRKLLGGRQYVCNQYEFDALKKEIFQVALRFEDPRPPDITVSVVRRDQEKLVLSQQFSNPEDVTSESFRIKAHGVHDLNICLPGESPVFFPYSFELKLIKSPYIGKLRD